MDKKYHVLYATHQLSTSLCYVGVHSTKKLNDSYLGCGITCNINKVSCYVKRAVDRSPLWEAVLRCGKDDFKRSDLLFFNSRRELIEAEKMLITWSFVKQNWNFNRAIGGGMPPTNIGEKNGNFGNRWSDEQKKAASDYFRSNRNTKRGNNSRAVPCIAVNIFTKQVKRYECGRDLADDLGFTHLTMNTWLRDGRILSSGVRSKKYVCFREEDYLKKGEEGCLDNFIQEVINKSNLKYKPNYDKG